MRELQQTRIHNPSEILGNCFPTVIACFLDLNSPEDVIQIQEKYLEEDWKLDELYEIIATARNPLFTELVIGDPTVIVILNMIGRQDRDSV